MHSASTREASCFFSKISWMTWGRLRSGGLSGRVAGQWKDDAGRMAMLSCRICRIYRELGGGRC